MPISKSPLEFLEIIAGIVAGSAVHVVISNRLKGNVTVALASRSIVLSPRAGFFDLCVAARILRTKSEAGYRKSDEITNDQRRVWVRGAVDSLYAEFPHIGTLSSTFDIDCEETWPEILLRNVPLKPLAARDGEQFSHPKIVSDSVVDFTGTHEDMHQLLATINSGKYPTENWDVLREMPIVKVPLEISAARMHGVDYESYERFLRATEQQDTVQNIIDCYISRSEDAVQKMSQSWSSRGSKIDVLRLAELAARDEDEDRPKIFVRPRPAFDRRFNARQHHAVVAIDCHSAAKKRKSKPHSNLTCVGIFTEVFRQLEIDLTVLAFADQIVEDQATGKKRLVHLQSVIKRASDPFDGRFFNRMTAILTRPPLLPGAKPCCFHPLLFRSSFESLWETQHFNEYSQHRLLVVANRGMPKSGRFNRKHFLSRSADAIDRMIKHNEHRLPGEFQAACCIIPADLKRNAKPGGATSKMLTIKS